MCSRICALQGVRCFNENIFEPLDVVTAHSPHGELDGKIFKPLERLVEIRGLAAGKCAYVKPAIGLDLEQPCRCQYPDDLAEWGFD
jgi:hypothetical protein